MQSHCTVTTSGVSLIFSFQPPLATTCLQKSTRCWIYGDNTVSLHALCKLLLDDSIFLPIETRKMEQFAGVFVIFGVALLFVNPLECRDIYVDPIHGVQNQSCWDGGEMLPCRTIDLAFEGTANQTSVWIGSGNYWLNMSFEFWWTYDVAIVAASNNTAFNHGLPVEVECESDAGLTFVYSRNITITGIVFLGCGVLHNSTSKNFEVQHFTFETFYAAFYFLFCKDIHISYLSITRSTGIGMVIYSTVGANIIEHSNFSHNSASRNSTGGGGLYIEFAYCAPDSFENVECSNGTNVPHDHLANAHFTISHCGFHNNSANITNSVNYTFILPQLCNHMAFGRGGGLSVFFKGNATNNTIIVDHSVFQGNTALWGAGIFVEYQDWSQNNSFEIYSSILECNHCYNSDSDSSGTGGGGSRVGYIFFDETHANQNSILFDSCHFVNNWAYFGGGLSFYTAREPTEAKATNSLELRNCEWKENTARVGSAVDLSVWHTVPLGATVMPQFTNCTFINNSVYTPSDLGSVVGIGAFYADSIPVCFYGNVTFEQNSNSALAAVSTGIYFEEDCQASFVRNAGRTGGGIALLGYAFIQTSPGTQLHFVNNSAEIRGGAIFAQSIGEHDLISSRNCFFRYKDIKVTPFNWTSYFYFDHNFAKGVPNSIYATSLLTCQWGGAYGSAEENANQVFCWTDNWEYSPGNCSDEIATSPASFDRSVIYNMKAIPGKREPLPITVYDDRRNNVTNETVFTARALTSTIHIDSTSQYISDNMIELHGNPNNDGSFSLETADARVLYTKVNVTLMPCPPGMIQVETECKCGGDYGGLVQCLGTEFQAKLQRGSWMGYYTPPGENASTYIYAGECPYCSQLTKKQSFYVSDLEMCTTIHRNGTLCGKCLNGYGPVVNDDAFSCNNCSTTEAKYHWVFYLMTEFLSVTIFFFIVLLFNISVTSGPANAFVFFAQILTSTLKIDGDGAILLQNVTSHAAILKDVYIVVYDIWNLNFFRPFLPKFCLSSDISTLQLLSLGYITAFYPIILTALSFSLWWLYGRGIQPVVCIFRPLHYCFARFRRIWNLQRSIIHAFATFLLLSYTKFTLVSFILLTPTPIVNDQGEPVGPGVVYYDGTIDYLSSNHIPYVVAAVIFLLIFVALPPVILIAPSLLRTFEKIFNTHICIKFHPGPSFQQFLDAFHGCYKDGTEEGEGSKYDLRWFAGFYFINRILLFAIFAFTPHWIAQYLLQQLAFTGLFLLFALFRPYKEDFYNKVDSTIFAILAAINALTMYNYYLSFLEINLSKWVFGFQYFLIFCPLVYMVVYVIFKLWKTHGTKVKTCIKAKFPNCKICCFEDNENDEEFLRFTADSGRLHGSDHSRQPSRSSNNPENTQLLEREPTVINPSPSQRSSYGTIQSTNPSTDTVHSITD